LEEGGHSLATHFSSNFDPNAQNPNSTVQFRLLLFSVNPTKEIPFPAEPGHHCRLVQSDSIPANMESHMT
jgi:hypothetical protein